jgi:hypothetical protein
VSKRSKQELKEQTRAEDKQNRAPKAKTKQKCKHEQKKQARAERARAKISDLGHLAKSSS